MIKPDQQFLAIQLRKQGHSYSEILQQVPVAKSTLSLWLKAHGLSRPQQQRLTKKRYEAALRGAQKKKNDRLLRVAMILEECRSDIRAISDNERWLMGIMLYWAEGSKEKVNRPGSGVVFNNSDGAMIHFFLNWLQDSCQIPRSEIAFEIYLHEKAKNSLKEVQQYWSRVTKFPIKAFNQVYFKKSKPKTNRSNVGQDYWGLLRIKVRASSTLNRKIAGWIIRINEIMGSGVMATRLPLKQKTSGSTPGSPAKR